MALLVESECDIILSVSDVFGNVVYFLGVGVAYMLAQSVAIALISDFIDWFLVSEYVYYFIGFYGAVNLLHLGGRLLHK